MSPDRQSQRPLTSAEERTAKLTLKEISAVFHMPLHEACVQLQADEPALKKRYRELGITAWPYRKRYKFDNPTIENMVRAAGSNKLINHDNPSPKSPFGNFLLTTQTMKKKPKKESSEQEEKVQFAVKKARSIRRKSPEHQTPPTPHRQSYHPYQQPHVSPHIKTQSPTAIHSPPYEEYYSPTSQYVHHQHMMSPQYETHYFHQEISPSQSYDSGPFSPQSTLTTNTIQNISPNSVQLPPITELFNPPPPYKQTFYQRNQTNKENQKE